VSSSILDVAKTLVNGDRQHAYGVPEVNHERTAELWSAYLGPDYHLTAHDVCMLNILQKVSRLAHAPTRDGHVDIAGYAENAERCAAANQD